MIYVKKRITGKQVPFCSDNIFNAIKKAMVKVNKTSESDLLIAQHIATDIEQDLINEKVECIDVENIQDRVEKYLILRFNYYPDLIREYLTYRDRRNIERLKDNELNEINKQILDTSNNALTNENANLNARSYAGKMTKFGSENAKWYAEKNIIPEKLMSLHKEGRYHIHDLDNYAVGNHNCTFIDMGPLLKNGFFTGNGSVRGAKSLAVAFDLIPIIFQSQQNCEYGGVATNKVDYDLEPFVKLSFRKHFAKGLRYLPYNLDRLLRFLGIDDTRLKLDDIQSIVKNSEEINISNESLKNEFYDYYTYALDETVLEANQGAQAMIHNLNTMCSRAGKLSARVYSNIN
jgi:ribonucleoside-triphosphate reductase